MNSLFRDYGRSLALGALAGIMMAAIFAAGFFTRELVDLPVFVTTPENSSFPLLGEVEGLLERYYLRPLPDNSTRQYAAIRGLLGTLGDHNTFFIEPPVARSESDALAGTYGGIGVQLQRSTEGEYIIFPFADSPAKNAGLQEGDILLAVNGSPVSGAIQQDAVDQMLRGEVKPGNGVELTVRHMDDEEQTLFIEFGVINVPSVIWRVLPEDNRIGYIRILRFTNRTPSETEEALNGLRAAGVQALVLDLRDNGGGLLQESVKVASQFLNGGVVLYEKTHNNEKTFNAEGSGLVTDLPVAVLVNEWTASAAELVAGALLDRERGILIGQKTYGKGTIQQIFELADKSSIHITAAEWFTPNRRTLDGVGLEPTIPVEKDNSGRDVELSEALRYLQEQLNTKEIPS